MIQFINIYLLGSIISLILTLILFRKKDEDKLERAIEESENMIPDEFKIRNPKEVIKFEVILLGNILLSWITVFTILISYLVRLSNSIKTHKKQ